jgi:uncharacterized membrane protein (Fun14 family)
MVQEAVTPDNVKRWDIFNKPTNWYMHIGAFFVGGFVAGILLKYVGRYVIWLLIAGGLLLWSLELLNVVSVNYTALKGLVGLAPDTPWSELFTAWGTWARAHVAESVAAVLGLLFSWIIM